MTAFPIQFPTECSAHIFAFLEMRDVCSFASASVGLLRECLPEFNRRRSRMRDCYAYSRDWKQGALREKVGLCQDMMEKYPEIVWVPMPSVEDRVRQLCQRIPPSHPLCRLCNELRSELCINMDEGAIYRCPSRFMDVFPRYQRILHAHKLHSNILLRAMHSNPVVNDNMIHSNALAKENSTTLSQYLGDVLCVAHLINQSNLRIVEGGPTNTTFMKELRRQPPDSSCYRSWVYVHSSILRVKHFSDVHRRRLGIPEMQPALSEMIQNDCYINEFFLSSEMTLAFSDFGPLGPIVRGRDVVRLRECPARRLFAFLITNDDVHVFSETARTALEWMCLLHEEARKTRPMTVRAPVIRLCSPTLGE